MAKLVQLKDKDGYVYPKLLPTYENILNNTIKRQTNINYSDDFNDLVNTGMYWYNAYTGSGGANRPTDTKTMGILVVFAITDKYLTQIAFFNNGCWYRNIQDTEIKSWVKLN